MYDLKTPNKLIIVGFEHQHRIDSSLPYSLLKTDVVSQADKMGDNVIRSEVGPESSTEPPQNLKISDLIRSRYDPNHQIRLQQRQQRQKEHSRRNEQLARLAQRRRVLLDLEFATKENPKAEDLLERANDRRINRMGRDSKIQYQSKAHSEISFSEEEAEIFAVAAEQARQRAALIRELEEQTDAKKNAAIQVLSMQPPSPSEQLLGTPSKKVPVRTLSTTTAQSHATPSPSKKHILQPNAANLQATALQLRTITPTSTPGRVRRDEVEISYPDQLVAMAYPPESPEVLPLTSFCVHSFCFCFSFNFICSILNLKILH